MSVPEGIFEIGLIFISATVGFVIRLIFEKIKEIAAEVKIIDDKYRNNDRDLYEKVSDLRAEIKEIQAVLNCIKSK